MREMDEQAIKIEKIPTAELVKELSRREGVLKKIAEPYQTICEFVEGPAIVLVIID